jgi:predicted nucleotidyltransferase component of viral defense system
MRLHHNRESFLDLIAVTAPFIGIPETAVKRDYYIVLMLKNLQDSVFSERCVFKGGTSLSKCYPNSINRFSEDVDLTYLPDIAMSDKQIDKALKKVESAIIGSAFSEKINDERNDRNKSSYVWFENDGGNSDRIKLEIGSSVKPEPYEKRPLRTYIHQYLEHINMTDVIGEYGLCEVLVNTLGIERTFLDKIFAVKRHACCGTLEQKVRHIYDVTKLLERQEIQDFLADREELKRLIGITKQTDSFYLEKRGIPDEYNPRGRYEFSAWRRYFSESVRSRYESLYEDLLYENEKQDFTKAIEAFLSIDAVFAEIGE